MYMYIHTCSTYVWCMNVHTISIRIPYSGKIWRGETNVCTLCDNATLNFPQIRQIAKLKPEPNFPAIQYHQSTCNVSFKDTYMYMYNVCTYFQGGGGRGGKIHQPSGKLKGR